MAIFLKKFFVDEVGATAVEYALICGLIAVALIAGMNIVTPKLTAAFQIVSEAVPAD